MTAPLTAYLGARIFDGKTFHTASALVTEHGIVTGICAENEVPDGAERHQLTGGILCPGFVDLQVNGGGGVMFNDTPDIETLRRMAAAHAVIGATSILPTLITDTPEHVKRAIDAAIAACKDGVPGIAGLHLEGPHLSVARKGAHSADLIRPMTDADMALYLEAAPKLPVLKITLAPESVSTGQIETLSKHGVLVSLGHTDSTFETCKAAANAGARCVTHLFNAQSQLGNREPGVVGAALRIADLSAGLIADGIHVHPQTMEAALAAKKAPGQIFLVSDAMATAGTDMAEFTLNGRRIRRADSRLTLEDGTLAGAHLELTEAIRNLVTLCSSPLDHALAMATSIPAGLIGQADRIGTFRPGARADILHLTDDLVLGEVWPLR